MRIRYSEMFYSLQGEGRFVGVPSVFLRMFGCNFTCDGFGQPRERTRWLPPSEMPYQTQDLSGIRSLASLPVVPVGCDSSASWAARYRHLTHAEPVSVVAQRLRALTPSDSWGSVSGEPIHLVITGGEPLLVGWQRAYPSLLSDPALGDLRELTFETNGTQPLRPALHDALCARGLSVNWSVSPKLRRSGEDPAASIRPDVVATYAALPGSVVYLKFVVHDGEDVDEAVAVVSQYRAAGIPLLAVYAMPVGGRSDMYDAHRDGVVKKCLESGLRYSPRLHVDLFGNQFGT